MRKQFDENVRISKSLTYILRHGALKEGLTMESDGYVKLADILAKQQFKKCSVKQIQEIVNSNDKKRFEICSKNQVLYIRATQGHSIALVEDQELLVPVKSPAEYPVLVHGTYRAKWDLIKIEGLKTMNRNHIHLAPGMPQESQVISGMRANCNVFIFIDGELAMKDGIEFFISANNVILTKGINGILPPKYFKIVQARNKSVVTTIYTALEGEIKTVEIEEEKKLQQVNPKPKYNSNFNFYPIDYLLVLDFEAQCINNGTLPVQEIIEFPVVPIDMKTKQILSEKIFHYYIKPVVVPTLTEFCTNLTGIQQAQVDSGIQITEALSLLHQFLEKNDILKSNFAFITCGDWDFKTCLSNECKVKHIDLPDYLKRWINVKEVTLFNFQQICIKPNQQKKRSFYGMAEMLDLLELPLDGRHHSGIDDAKNIAKIAKSLLELNVQIDFSYLKPKQYQKQFLMK